MSTQWRKDTTLAEMVKDHDWQEALAVALAEVREVLGVGVVSDAPFAWSNVVELVASSAGENDGENWLALLYLADGRYAYLSAWCDYTGWG